MGKMSIQAKKFDPGNLYMAISHAVPVPIIATQVPTPIIKITELNIYVGRTDVAKCDHTFSSGDIATHIIATIGEAMAIAVRILAISQVRFGPYKVSTKFFCFIFIDRWNYQNISSGFVEEVV
tara:strand:- start:389 stop:757 length:369 start_codon:yes stop_codon:yes gene_type:complete